MASVPSKMPLQRLFGDYQLGPFYDEMFSSPGEPRPHYAKIFEKIGGMIPAQFEERRQHADLAFLLQGITFTVYSDGRGTERLFPFDLIPRIIPNSEWLRIESGLAQRVVDQPQALTGTEPNVAGPRLLGTNVIRPDLWIEQPHGGIKVREICPLLSDCTQWVLPQSACCPVGRMGSMRALSNSTPARPYMARLRVFSRLICPSVWPLLQVSVIALRTAARS